MCAIEDEELCHHWPGDPNSGLILHSNMVAAPWGTALAFESRIVWLGLLDPEKADSTPHTPSSLSPRLCSYRGGYPPGVLWALESVISDGPCSL